MRMSCYLLILLLLATTIQAQEQSSKCALQQLAIDAALGNDIAQYNLGVEFFRGTSVPQDYAKAANLWRKASDAGNTGASNNLGYLTYYGKGVAQDYAEGLRLWRLAAGRGLAESQVHMAQAYSDGRFLKIDLIEAYAWAKAGKHNSTRMEETMENPQIAELVARDADKVLAEVSRKLSHIERAAAEKKAAEYIRKFAPK